MNFITALLRLGAGSLAESVLLGGGQASKGVGPATQKLIHRYATELPGLRYEDARNVVRRVQRQIAAAARIQNDPTPDTPIRSLPRRPELENYPGVNFHAKVAIEFTSPAGQRSYRTVTVIESDRILSTNEIRALAESQVRADRGYEPKQGTNRRTNKELRNWEVTDFQIITASRR